MEQLKIEQLPGECPEIAVMRAFKEVAKNIPRHHSIAAAKWMLGVALDPTENLPGYEMLDEAITAASKHQFTVREAVACSSRITRLWRDEKRLKPGVRKHPIARLAIALARATLIGYR